MANDRNQLQLLGHIGPAAELRYLETGMAQAPTVFAAPSGGSGTNH